ncbi:MAG: flagellar protein FlgN [Gammaproteobacteria bacterium]|nr:flagellar protein FlgN [Gammaproteobacteria bacterium]MCK5091598.1 flagellar protein FlgN [Gammaproteobacteria bacterium]
MNKQNTYVQLEKLISQELECAEMLLDILSDERTSLADNPEELIKLASIKQDKIGQLEQINEQRNSALKQVDFDTRQVKECIQWCSSDTVSAAKLTDKWESLLTSIDKCRQYNQTNGTIIDNSQRKIRQALAILHGQNPENIAYSATGKAIDSGAHRTIAKA